MKPRKLGIPALRKYRSKAANWDDLAAYDAEMRARIAGLAGWQGSGKAESFDGRSWTVDGAQGAQLAIQGAQLAGLLALEAGCARCGEPMDDKATRGLCSPCEKEVARKQDAMIEEAAIAEAA